MKLQVEGARKVYRNSKVLHEVLGGVSLSVEQGQYVTLLGPSGCGKTTLLNVVAGFQCADAGRVLLDGEEVRGPGPDRGFIFQSYALFPWMKVRDNVLYPMRQLRVPRDEQERRLAELLSIAHLDGRGDLYPHQLSGGMKQRVAVIRALASRPKVLLMDEPFGAVDFQMRIRMQEEMERIWLADHTTVLMVTHDVEEAVYMSDRVLIMSSDRGRIIEDLTIELPRSRERKGEAYHRYEDHLVDVLRQAFAHGEAAREREGAPAVDASRARAAAHARVDAPSCLPEGGAE